MIDFTQQLQKYDGTPITTNIKGEDGKLKKIDLTLSKVSEFALLDIANFQDGLEHPLNSAKSMQERYNLMRKIDKSPEKVELSEEEKELLTDLIPLKFEVQLVGQIMNILQ